MLHSIKNLLISLITFLFVRRQIKKYMNVKNQIKKAILEGTKLKNILFERD